MFLRSDGENRPIAHTVTEDHLIHPDRDKATGRKIETGGDPARLVDPAQQTPAEEKPIVVEILGKNETTAHFGLGTRGTPVDRVRVEWPSGLVQDRFLVEVDRVIRLVETEVLFADGFETGGTSSWSSRRGTCCTLPDREARRVQENR